MNENDDDVAKETIYGLAIPANWGADEVLFRLLNEMRDPINSIESYANIISEMGSDPNYITGLLKNVEILRNLCDSTRVFLMDTNYLSQEKEVMYFLRERVFNPIVYSPEASNELKEMIVNLVRKLNAEARWQMVDSWVHMISNPGEFELIKQMKDEGFSQFETTLAEFRTRFAQD